jgi:hypothetical protein
MANLNLSFAQLVRLSRTSIAEEMREKHRRTGNTFLDLETTGKLLGIRRASLFGESGFDDPANHKTRWILAANGSIGHHLWATVLPR